MDAPASGRRALEKVRLQALRDQVASVMLALDEIGLHRAAEHVSMSLLEIDAATSAPSRSDRAWLH
jgi:hypothetical protein